LRENLVQKGDFLAMHRDQKAIAQEQENLSHDLANGVIFWIRCFIKGISLAKVKTKFDKK
jgi:hypothetical protein